MFQKFVKILKQRKYQLLQLFEKNIIENWHWTLEQVDNHDYYDLIDVFKANEDNKMASFDDLKKMFGQ